jgi:hypothetical protein
VDGCLLGLNLDGFVGRVQYDFGEEIYSLGEELAFEGKGELGEFAGDLDVELAAERVHEFINLVLGVFGSAAEGALGYEVGD